MTTRQVVVSWIVLAAAASLASWGLRGAPASLGMVLGLVGTTVGMLGWWFAIRLLGSVHQDKKVSPIETFLSLSLLLLKLPIMLMAWRTAASVGPPAPDFFLYGLALVYFATIHWALSQR